MNAFFRRGQTCSHVAVILFQVAAFVESGMTKLTATDKPQVWQNVSAHQILPERICKIPLRCNSAQRATSELKAPSPKRRDSLLSMIENAKPNSVSLAHFKGKGGIFIDNTPIPEKKQLPMALRNLYK